jgi:hypothetical protein
MHLGIYCYIHSKGRINGSIYLENVTEGKVPDISRSISVNVQACCRMNHKRTLLSQINGARFGVTCEITQKI